MLTGQVIDSDARPVGGALVRLADVRFYRDIMVAGKVRPKAYTTRTTELGEFKFEKVTQGLMTLGAEHLDHPLGSLPPFVLKGGEHKILRLPAPVNLSGILAPPNARVTAAFRYPGADSPHATMPTYGIPEEGGTYRLERVPARQSFRVTVEAPGHVTKLFGPYALEGGEHRIDFTLERGEVLTGTVRRLSGEPVADASIMLGQKRARTDENGTFEIAGLEDKPMALIVSKTDHLQVVMNDVRPGHRNITLPRCVKISGRVEGGNGLFLCYSNGNSRFRNKLSKSGAFALSSVPPGKTRLDVEDTNRRVVASLEIDGLEGAELTGLLIRVQ